MKYVIENVTGNKILDSEFDKIVEFFNMESLDWFKKYNDEYKATIKGKKLIVIEGIIGSGKSYVCEKYFSNNILIDEPLDLWKNIFINHDGKKNNILDHWYNIDSNEKIAFRMELQTIIIFTKIIYILYYLRNYNDTNTFIMERSFSSSLIFYKIMDNVDSKEYSILEGICENFEFPKENILYIYVHSFDNEHVQKCFNRINDRARSEEAKLSYSYLEKLYSEYNNFIKSSKFSYILFNN